MFQPAISVIIPTYNRSYFLSDAIESILNQTLSDFELIIMDDGSTDSRSAEIGQKYARRDKRIKFLSQDNQGVSIARNNAIAQSQSSYIATMDDDDISFPSRLEEQYVFMEANPDIAAVSCLTEVARRFRVKRQIDPKTVNHGTPKIQTILPKLNDKPEILVGNNSMIRRTVCGNSPYRSWFPRCVDFDLTLRLEEKNKIALLPKYLHRHHLHGGKHLSYHNRDIYLYQIAATISANERRNGHNDPIDENPDLEEVIIQGFPVLPKMLQRQLLWLIRKTIKQLLLEKDYAALQKLINLFEKISSPADADVIKRLKKRANVLATSYFRIGYFFFQ